MNEDQLFKLKFPIGKFQKAEVLTDELLDQYISDIESFPARLQNQINGYSDSQLDTPYRPGGWTIRQVVHHCADSHMNSLTRFKLALTEEKPVIKPYFEERWAELADSKHAPVEPALLMLKGIHQRWTLLLRSLKSEDYKRSFIHPEHGREITLEENMGVYAWHCNHHLAHISSVSW